MAIQLTEHQTQALHEALHESLRIATVYRQTVADEDSIALLQDLREIGRLLGIEDTAIQAEQSADKAQ